MLKKLVNLIEKIKCKLSCCYESKCSINDENNINDNYIENEIDKREAF